MKLASYHDGSRDGQLIVVSRDLSTAHYATGIATRLQQVLDDWNFLSPQLEELSVSLNHGRARHAFPFEPKRCAAPLPRAFQWVSGQAYPNHAALLAKAAGSEDTPSVAAFHQGSGDAFTAPHGDIVVASEKMGIDFEAGLAVITGDLPLGVSPERALDGVRLVVLANSIVLRHAHSRPTVAFGPVAVTPDELGEQWQGGRVHLPVQVQWNGKKVGLCDAAAGMEQHFGQLLARLAATRRIGAGAIVGSGVVSHEDASRGFATIAEKRALETLQHGEARTGYLRFGDTVQVDVKGADGQSVFGTIEQGVANSDDKPAEGNAEA